MFKKINPKSFFGLLMALGAGIAAFFTEVESQKKDKQIKDMEERITNLERRGAE